MQQMLLVYLDNGSDPIRIYVDGRNPTDAIATFMDKITTREYVSVYDTTDGRQIGIVSQRVVKVKAI